MYKKSFNAFAALAIGCMTASPSFAQSDIIKVNQVGFAPNAEKTATIEWPIPNGNKATLKQHAVSVVIKNDRGKQVWKGKVYEMRSSKVSDKKRMLVDFSTLTEEGKYTITTSDGVNKGKATFVISNRPYKELAAAAIKGFYFQRASMPIEEQYVGKWARPAGHLDTQVMIHPSAATAERPAGMIINSPWGWYDAGDYNKYIVNSSFAVGVMMGAYEQRKDYYRTQEVDIPEKNNGVPNILDEIYYNLKWMQTMQDTDGGLYHKLTTPSFEGFVAPSECKQQRYVVKKTTAATLDFAASMAMASRVYREFGNYFPGFSSIAIGQAEKAYAWAKKNPNVEYDQNKMNAAYDPDVSTGAYDDKYFGDEFFWAATELYLVTGKQEYREDAMRYIPKESFPTASWGNVTELAVLEWARLKDAKPEDAKVAADMKKLFFAHIAKYSDIAGTPFNSPYGNDASDFFWGCNSEGCTWRGAELMYAYDFTGDASYKENARRCMNYVLGQNATGYCYVTGFGTKPSIHPHQRLASTPNGAYPGFLVGGPNPGQQDKGENLKYTSNVPDESYMDDMNSYASNEIAINWNATLVALAGWLDSE